jgi:hypothetical protein
MMWIPGNLPGHAERKLAFVYALRGGGLLPCGESLIVGPGFACLCLSHEYLHGKDVGHSHLGSQRISDLEGVCDVLIIGGMFSSSTGKGRVILVGLYVSHFSCQYVEIPGATTFHVALPSRLQCKCLFFVTSTRHPARGIYGLTTELQTRTDALQKDLRFHATLHDSGMQKMENTMITAPARVSALLPSTNRASRTRLLVRLFGPLVWPHATR